MDVVTLCVGVAILVLIWLLLNRSPAEVVVLERAADDGTRDAVPLASRAAPHTTPLALSPSEPPPAAVDDVTQRLGLGTPKPSQEVLGIHTTSEEEVHAERRRRADAKEAAESNKSGRKHNHRPGHRSKKRKDGKKRGSSRSNKRHSKSGSRGGKKRASKSSSGRHSRKAPEATKAPPAKAALPASA